MQKLVLDQILKNFYQIFHHVFEDLDQDFQREVLSRANFRYLAQDVEDEEDAPGWIKDEQLPIIEQSGRRSKYVYFVLAGNVHIMNKEGMYEYGLIQEGGYFGDISVLLNRTNEYGYYYNPHTDKPVILLALRA